MNNVTTLQSTADRKARHFSKFNESSIFFPTFPAELQFVGHRGTYGVRHHKAIVRMIDDKPSCLGIVGRHYTTVGMKDLCGAVEDQFLSAMSDDELHGVEVNDRQAYDGSFVMRDYMFPACKADLGEGKHTVNFRTTIINGYDGTQSVKIYSGAIYMFCTNGMVTGAFDLTVRKHTKGLTIETLVEHIRRSIDVFYKQADVWIHWSKRTITDEMALACFSTMPNCTESLRDKLFARFQTEIKTHGRTVWAMYNAATYYASHNSSEFGIRNENGVASILHERELRVQRWSNSTEFMKLAA